jgi:hypothetical protein
MTLRHLPAETVSEWFRIRIVPLLAALGLGVDIGFGVILLLSPDREFQSSIFEQARSLMSMQSWGLLLLCLAQFVALTWWVQGRCRIAGFLLTFALGSGYWLFWAILSAWSSFGPNGSTGIMSVLACGMAGIHVLAGLSWPLAGHEHRVRLR